MSAIKENFLRVCFVTSHFAGPARNSGLGTAFAALAETLAADGHDVHVLYLREKCDERDPTYWIQYYQTRNIKLIHLSRYDQLDAETPYALRRPYEAYLWLKDQPEFDVIHYADCYGVGFYIALAKKSGLGFENTTLIADVHGASSWLRERNEPFAASPPDLQHDDMERYSVACADIAISPSQYMFEYLKNAGWQLPSRTHVLQNLLPFPPAFLRQNQTALKEIIFFGRLEHGKGLDIFCDALDRLDIPHGEQITITFLGNTVKMQAGNSLDYIKQRAFSWRFAWQVLFDKGHAAAMEYIMGDGRLPVMPSRCENSPYTVLECLGLKIPFLVSRVGGVPELIKKEDQNRVCFELSIDALTEKLRSALNHMPAPAQPAIDFTVIRQAWIGLHCNIAKESKHS